jgi:16S rRNA processing protein RimM
MQSQQTHALGKIIGAYGIKGWVKVETFAPAAESLLKTSAVWRASNGTSYSVLACRVQGAGPRACLVAQLDGIVQREEAQALRGVSLLLERDQFPQMQGGVESVLAGAAGAINAAGEADSASDTYYQADLVGLSVVNRAGLVLGTVSTVDSHGAGEFLVVEGGPATCLIPFRSTYVDTVDLLGKRISVDWELDWG